MFGNISSKAYSVWQNRHSFILQNTISTPLVHCCIHSIENSFWCVKVIQLVEWMSDGIGSHSLEKLRLKFRSQSLADCQEEEAFTLYNIPEKAVWQLLRPMCEASNHVHFTLTSLFTPPAPQTPRKFIRN